jgi:fatty-acyl-CoA synthase
MEEKVYRTELTPLSFLERSTSVFPEKTAIVHGNRQYTYREFAWRVNRLASHLRASGLQRHDRVAFLCPNIPALLEAHYAIPAAGGILVAVNTRLNSHEIAFILTHSGVKFLFVDAELFHLIEPLTLEGLRVVRIDDTGSPEDPYEQYLAAGSSEPIKSWLEDEEETISINYTSGTTGNPKGVMYTYRGAYLNALTEVIETGLNSDSVYLWTLPMFHCNGWCFTWAVTAAGAPPSPTLLEQLAELNTRPIHVYGLTETYGPYTICEWHSEWDHLPFGEQARLLARQGQHNVTSDPVRVVDGMMNDVPRDGQTMGEVVMHGNNVMKGYYENPEGTDVAFEGGWFHSGDIGVWHPDGYIELRDRAKDVIISGGENISTIEVEQTVAQHPAVMECAVVAIPDEKWGERPKAYVTLKKGETATEQEIITFCRERLAHFKCPAAVEFGSLPKTSTGKIQKFVLRDKEWEGREKHVN